MIDLPKHYLQLSIGAISILSGENIYVKPSLQVEEKLKPDRINPGSAKVSIPNTSKPSDLKNSVLSENSDDSHEVSKISKRLI